MFSETAVERVESGLTRTLLGGLQKFQKYVTRIAAFTKHGNGPGSDATVASTDEDGEYILLIPHPIYNLRFQFVTSGYEP